MTGTIFDISHYMLEDGPGIRTNVFVKGCPLRCKWCSNAYGLEKRIQLSYKAQKCVGCGKCIQICPENAITWNEKKSVVVQKFEKCRQCLCCVQVCNFQARAQVGIEKTVEEVVKAVLDDRMFYRRSGGGVTLSGGEILGQADFVGEILKKCVYYGIHTAIETSGYGKWEDLKRILGYTKLVFLDCKCMNREKHKALTGVGNEIILENIVKTAQWCEKHGKQLIIRLPLIPTLNDDDINVRDTAKFVKELRGKPLLNVLPYHNFGASKYETIGKRYPTEDLQPQESEDMQRIKKIFEEVGVRFSVGGYNI